jgi:hypothetical protein
MVTSPNASGNVDLDQVESWLQILHGASTGLMHICSVGNWAGRTFAADSPDGHQAAVEYIRQLDASGVQGIYLRATTLTTAPPKDEEGRSTRGGDELSRTFPGFWADIDIAGPGHKTTKPLPADVDAAMSIVAESGLPTPTYWIHSGGGLYPWWLLDNPVEIENAAYLARTQALSARWHELLRDTAERLGMSYGPVGDLARVLRIPGTVNRKVEGEPRPCRIMEDVSEGRLYTMKELVQALEAGEAIAATHHPKPAPPAPKPTIPRPRAGDDDERPGDRMANQMPWDEIMASGGYQFDRTHGEETFWVRPGKNRRDGHSCTTNYGGSDLLYVFSTEMEGFEPERSYSKFATWSILNNFGSDYRAAAKALAAQGYGSQRQPATPPRPLQPSQVADGGGDPERVEVHENALPDVDVTNSAFAITAVQTVINSGAIPGLYVRDGELVEVTEVSGHFDETDDFKPIGIRVVTADSLTRIFVEKANVFKWVKVGRGDESSFEAKPTALAATTAKAVLSSAVWSGVPVLRDIVEAPVLRADGSLLQTPGYDGTSRLYLHPRVQMEPVPDEPGETEVAEARDFLLDKVLGDFPWSSQADRANYVALLMTPILRPYLGGLVPLGAVSATERGSGKTLLTDIIGRLYGSVSRPWVPGDEELRKSITTILMGDAAPVVVFDNVGDGERVEAATLAKLLTSKRWDDRALGTNKGFSGQNDRMWMVTGNNVALGGDIASRTVLVSIDPKMPSPELRRNFQLGDLEEWLEEPRNRARLLRCLLILARSWIVGGAEKADFTMRGFSPWAKALGGLVAFHGLSGFLGNTAEVADSDAEADEWTAFFQAWHTRYGNRPQSASAVITESKSLMFHDPWREVLPSDTAVGLGMLLKARKGRHYSGFVLKGRKDTHRKVWEWWVATSDDEPGELVTQDSLMEG